MVSTMNLAHSLQGHGPRVADKRGALLLLCGNVKLPSKYVFVRGLARLLQRASADAECTGQIMVEGSARNGATRFTHGLRSTAEELGAKISKRG